MDRRAFITILGGSILAAPLAAEAQLLGKVYRVGIIDNEASLQAPRLDAFLKELRKLGWIEGSNLIIEARIGSEDQFRVFAGELAGLNLDLIFAAKSTAALTTLRVTQNIPIVVAVATDPVGMGLVKSLARPGGNITGTATMLEDLGGKHLELLKTTAPGIRRVAVFFNSQFASSVKFARELEPVAKTLGVRVHSINWDHPDRLVSAFAEAKSARADALVVAPNILSIPHGGRIGELALKHRLPSMALAGTLPERGGLMSYGPEQVDMYRRAAHYVDKILKGAKPADLPMEQASKFELVINLQTAKALGLKIPPSVLGRADRIIE